MHRLRPLVRFFYGLVFLCCCANEGVAQSAPYAVRYFGVADGLPSRIVHDVATGPAGFTWLLTEYGLYRFDGFEFVAAEQIYPTLDEQALGVQYRSMRTGPDGALWLRPAYFGEDRLHRFDPATGILRNFSDTSWQARTVVLPDERPGYALGGDAQTRRLHRLEAAEVPAVVLEWATETPCPPSARDRLTVSPAGEVYAYDDCLRRATQLLPRRRTLALPPLVSPVPPELFYADSRGRLWWAQPGGALYYLSPGGTIFETLPVAAAYGAPRRMWEDGVGNLVFAVGSRNYTEQLFLLGARRAPIRAIKLGADLTE